MGEVDKYYEIFDIIDNTQEAFLKSRRTINWSNRGDRYAFFTALAKSLTDHTTVFRKAGQSRKTNAMQSVLADLENLEGIYGKAVVKQAITQKYDLSSNRTPEC